MNIQSFILVFIGGGLGSIIRYGLSVLIPATRLFYLSTFLANGLAAFLIGFFLMRYQHNPEQYWFKLFFATGICGGLSTFSTFSFEHFQLIQQARYAELGAYIISSLIFCLIALFIGYKLA